MTDAVQIKDAWVINIGIQFAIYTKRGINKNEVLLSCVDTLKTYFQTDKWQINQPIVLSDVVSEILKVEGVATVVEPPGQVGDNKQLILVSNKTGTQSGNTYSNNLYDVKGATFNGVVYPSVDPAIFEIKYPNVDIQGRVMGDL